MSLLSFGGGGLWVLFPALRNISSKPGLKLFLSLLLFYFCGTALAVGRFKLISLKNRGREASVMHGRLQRCLICQYTCPVQAIYTQGAVFLPNYFLQLLVQVSVCDSWDGSSWPSAQLLYLWIAPHFFRKSSVLNKSCCLICAASYQHVPSDCSRGKT